MVYRFFRALCMDNSEQTDSPEVQTWCIGEVEDTPSPFVSLDQPEGTLWDVVVRSDEAELTDDQEFVEALAGQGSLMRAAMQLRALDRFRDELDRIPCTAAPGDPVTLRVQDAVLLARMLLRKLA